MLESSQYRQLKERAAKANTGLGELIRRAIDRFLGETEKKGSLETFCGAMEDAECTSKNYKKFIYSDARKNIR